MTMRDDSTINRTLRRKWKLVVQTILEGKKMRGAVTCEESKIKVL